MFIGSFRCCLWTAVARLVLTSTPTPAATLRICLRVITSCAVRS